MQLVVALSCLSKRIEMEKTCLKNTHWSKFIDYDNHDLKNFTQKLNVRLNFKSLVISHYQGIVETICHPFLLHPLLKVSQHKF